MDLEKSRVNEEAILRNFNMMRQKSQDYTQKIAELEGDRLEHNLVIGTMEKMDGARKCYRMIGGVIVERTVGEVLPAVKKNRDGLEKLVSTLKENHADLQKKIAEYIKTYDIKTKEQVEAEAAKEREKERERSGNKGVLA